MKRSRFLYAFACTASAAAVPAMVRAQADAGDPETSAALQSLRVLLGQGDAQQLDAGSLLFNGRRYRGTFTRAADGGIVNVVPLEQYLYSVVPREMPHSWPAAALQAQAIVARTFVLARSNPQRDYDLVPSETDQVYTGTDAEHAESNAAVDACAGQVLRFANAFAQVMYSSCCGGHTESNDAAWGGRALPYLSGRECPYCTGSPWYSWTRSIPAQQIVSALGTRLMPVSDVRAIELDAIDASGRAQIWRFSGPGGSADVPAKEVRALVGTRSLPSLRVRKADAGAAPSGGDVAIEGAGLGHGVGLCQWGARGMARANFSAGAILAYYYPGTSVGHD